MIKLHARVTKEIEITEEQAERIVNYLCGNVENCEFNDVRRQFTEGIDSGDYESGYIPFEWLVEDLGKASMEIRGYLGANMCGEMCNDIDL